jgi:hypothetical protein
MKKQLRFHALWFAILALILFATPVLAQVPQDMTYTGRLVDDLGDPLSPPVDLELRIFEDATGGTALYTEEHNGTALDATGGFSVQLGLGTSPSGTFDADLFADVNRWLEVVVGTDVLTPRQIIGSVPWALIAQQANEIVPDPNAPRFEDCGDGTVADHQTGLQWEKKTGTVGSFVTCEIEPAGCPDPHIVNNLYEWSNTGTAPDGGAFTDFLTKLNDPVFGQAATMSDVTGCFAAHCDWRLPNITELRTILIGPNAAPGQATTCSAAPCIDPGFAAVGGPTGASYTWSASTSAAIPSFAWSASFSIIADVLFNDKSSPGDDYVRAVRAGSCN